MNVHHSAGTGSLARSSAPTTFGFRPGHVFAVNDGGEVLYEHVAHDALILQARPVDRPAMTQVFTQEEFRELIDAGKVDPRVSENQVPRHRLRALNPDISCARDLDEDEKAEADFYWKLCRRIWQMYEDREISRTDHDLRPAIRRVMGELAFGYEAGSDDGQSRRRGRVRPRQDEPREIRARKTVSMRDVPAPSTVRRWLNRLRDHDWNLLALRDRRKGRSSGSAPRALDPEAVEVMDAWVRAYLDRSRPSMALLYRLMVGSQTAARENAGGDGAGVPRRPDDPRSFAEVNVEREAEGLPPLRVPSKRTFERAVGRLDRFEVIAGREGPGAARKRSKVMGMKTTALAPGERVQIDCWKAQVLSLKPPKVFWRGLKPELVDEVAKLRLVLCVAIDEATRVVLGMRLSVSADGEAALRALEMACSDKSEIARLAGCRSSWHHSCTPETVATDSGPEFIDAGFRLAVGDIGATNEIGPVKHPDARGVVERFFRTLDTQLMPNFQGRSFSNVVDKGDYDPGEFTHLLAAELGRALVRFVVDVYHNTPHHGLGGMTPNQAWTELSASYSVMPPPPRHVMQAAFGFQDARRIQNRGIRFMGLFYRSEDLARLRAKVGQADVRVRVHLGDLGRIWVSEAGSPDWFAVDCDLPMDGVSAFEWMGASRLLRQRHASVSSIGSDVALAALAEIRAESAASAERAGIGPSTMAKEDLKRQEDALFRHLSIEVPTERGHPFEGIDDVEVEDRDGPDASGDDDSGNGDDGSGEGVNRRLGRLGSDFF